MKNTILSFLVITLCMVFTSWDYHSVRGDKPDQHTHKNNNRSGNLHPERTIPYQFQELSPAIPEPSQTLMEACVKRRQALMDSLGGGITILSAAENLSRQVGNHFEYRQGSNFYYLTGFPEPNAVFLLIPGSENPFVMFVTPNIPWRTVSTGEIYGTEAAKKIFGADEVYSIRRLKELLPEFLKDKSPVYVESRDEKMRELVTDIFSEKTKQGKPEFRDPARVIHEMRVIKDQLEINTLLKAIDITSESHREAMKACRPDLYEYEIEAIIEYIYRKNGAYRPGFASIVGSGPNSTILHYRKSERKMLEGELLLVDIGGEFNMYTADITRTIPVNGKFTKEQKELYELVLKAQEEAIKLLIPGKGINESYKKALMVFADGLYNLGLVTDKNSTWQVRFYTVHGISHWLGLLVHDVGDYMRRSENGRILEPGMVLTIEPGLYLREDRLDYLHENLGSRVQKQEIDEFLEKVRPVYEKYKNIGIRIEDDILITETGHVVLSAKAPKTVDDIERTMTEKSRFVDD